MSAGFKGSESGYLLFSNFVLRLLDSKAQNLHGCLFFTDATQSLSMRCSGSVLWETHLSNSAVSSCSNLSARRAAACSFQRAMLLWTRRSSASLARSCSRRDAVAAPSAPPSSRGAHFKLLSSSTCSCRHAAVCSGVLRMTRRRESSYLNEALPRRLHGLVSLCTEALRLEPQFLLLESSRLESKHAASQIVSCTRQK